MRPSDPAGREIHLGTLQPLGLFPATSIFVGDYLTTPGQPPEADHRMIEEMGFERCPRTIILSESARIDQ